MDERYLAKGAGLSIGAGNFTAPETSVSSKPAYFRDSTIPKHRSITTIKVSCDEMPS
ncbi:MAG: hypothetical protein ABIL62_16520 [Planctomycetota bacterium]